MPGPEPAHRPARSPDCGARCSEAQSPAPMPRVGGRAEGGDLQIIYDTIDVRPAFEVEVGRFHGVGRTLRARDRRHL